MENGYKFYNLSDGTTKVLGFTIGNGDGGNDRAQMYDVDNIPSGVVTTLVYCANNVSGTNSFKLNGTSNRYLNSRDPYIAVWTGSALDNCAGSSFTFEEVSADDASTLISSRYDELKTSAVSYYEEEAGHEGELFYHTQAAIDNIKSICADKPTSTNELSTSVEGIKAFLSGYGIVMPTIGKRYALKNAHTASGYNYYAYMPISFGGKLTYTYDLCKNACWIVEEGTANGSYKFRNTATNYYITADNFIPSTGTFDYFIIPNVVSKGSTAIGNGNTVSDNKFLHINFGNTTGWAADAGASRWYFEEITDEAYNALPAIDESTMDFIALKAQLYNTKLPKATGTDVSDAQTAFTSSKTLENAKAYMTAVENNQYVRIISVSPFKDLQVENGTPVSNGVHNDYTIPTIWRLEFVDPANNDFRMKLRHMNTGKYLGAIYNSVGMSDDFTNGAAFTITSTDGDKFYIADGNGAKMCYTSTGSLTNSGSNNKWYMDFAKQTQIPLTTVGDKSYATAYLPFAVSAVSGASAYIGTLNDEHNYIDFTDVTSGFAANEGVVLEGEATTNAKAVLTIGGNAEKKNNCFTGSCTPVSVAEADRNNYRVLGVSTTDESRIAFFKPSAQLTTIGANRAFILNTNLSDVLNVRYGQFVEGIGQVTTAPATENAEAPVYDLTGRRVQKAAKGGVYIQNGKKFIVK